MTGVTANFILPELLLLLKPSSFMLRDGLKHSKRKRHFSISVHRECHRTAEGWSPTRDREVATSRKTVDELRG